MVSSEFKVLIIFSIVIMASIALVLFVFSIAVLCDPLDDFKTFVEITPFTIFAFYAAVEPQIIYIYDNEVRYHRAIFPFIKSSIAFEDADYYVTKEFETRYGEGIKVMIIKDSKIVFSFSSTSYSNIDEIISALPWEYRGEYHPGFLDLLKWASINESRIYKIDEKTT